MRIKWVNTCKAPRIVTVQSKYSVKGKTLIVHYNPSHSGWRNIHGQRLPVIMTTRTIHPAGEGTCVLISHFLPQTSFCDSDMSLLRYHPGPEGREGRVLGPSQ